MDRLQQQMGSVRHRRRSMDSPMMRQALKDAARRFAEACANKESSELGSEPSTGSMQGCAVHVTCCMQASAACRLVRRMHGSCLQPGAICAALQLCC